MTEYIIPNDGTSTLNDLRDVECNITKKEEFLSALTNTEMTNVMDLKNAHEISKKLKTLYEGDNQVNMAKLQSLKGKYESLKMNEDENISLYMQRVNKLVCSIKCAS
jgi:hypothetical protein